MKSKDDNKTRKRRGRPKKVVLHRVKDEAILEGIAQEIKEEPVLAKIIPPELPLALPKVKRVGGRSWFLLGISAGSLVLSALMAVLYLQARDNVVIATLFLLFGMAALLTFYFGIQKRQEGISFVRPGSEQKILNANCLNIYLGYDGEEKRYYCDSIEFEEMKPREIVSKHPQQCTNDKKWYYVHLYHPNKQILVPLVLPDMRFYPPEEMANVVSMPACRKVLRPRLKGGEVLKPVLGLVGIGILIFAFLVTTPPAGG